MSIIRKHKRGRRPSVTRNKKQGGKNHIKRKGGGDRDKSVREEMYGWRPGFDHPDQRVPDHVLRNITGHLQAQEEGNPRYNFPYPPRVFKQTMDKVEEPPPLAYPPPPKLTLTGALERI